ncbi:hypothetical protein O0L34_g18651 [Tuta absoluta]|nr:hypothetical protein O0L34_g18651 [Tuta absoluta]
MDKIASLSKNMDDLAALFTSKIAEFEKSIPPSQQQNNPILASEFYAFKSFILTAVSNLKAQIETRSRTNVLLLHGLPEKSDESLSQHFTTMCDKQLQIPQVTVNSISVCHRIGKNVSAEKPRPILIRCADNRVRREVWLAKRRLKGTGLTLSEFLTPARHALFLEARKALGVKDCWTMDGNIVAICPDGQRKRICTMSDLQTVVNLRGVHVAQPMQEAPPSPATGSNGAAGTPTVLRLYLKRHPGLQIRPAQFVPAVAPTRNAVGRCLPNPNEGTMNCFISVAVILVIGAFHFFFFLQNTVTKLFKNQISILFT